MLLLAEMVCPDIAEVELVVEELSDEEGLPDAPPAIDNYKLRLS